MDTKEIVAKALKGEDYSDLVKDLTPEDKAKVALAIKDAADAEAKVSLEKVTGLRQAEQALKDKKEKEVLPILETFKKEQLEKAKRKFYSDPDFELSDAEKTQFEAEVEKKGIQSTDADFIFEEMKRVYGSLKVDSLISDKKKAVEGQKGAAKFMQQAAGAGNAGSNPDPDKYSGPVKDLWQQVVASGHKNFSLDDAKAMYEKGKGYGTRTL
jgi:hypothetical protein